MFKPWNLDGKTGDIQYPKGEVVYQTKGVVIEPVYQAHDGKHYIEDNGKLLPAPMNPYNGYCYRQDGLCNPCRPAAPLLPRAAVGSG